MYKKVAITNRNLCTDLLEQIKILDNSDFDYIILREKDLSLEEYTLLAEKAINLSHKIILHNYVEACETLDYKKIHLPLNTLRAYYTKIKGYEIIGASTHSITEAKEAEKLGSTYVTASPIFRTKCKEDVEPKGLYWLKEICKSVSIPVYALGGINNINAQNCIEAGAEGVCMMSSAMTYK